MKSCYRSWRLRPHQDTSFNMKIYRAPATESTPSLSCDAARCSPRRLSTSLPAIQHTVPGIGGETRLKSCFRSWRLRPNQETFFAMKKNQIPATEAKPGLFCGPARSLCRRFTPLPAIQHAVLNTGGETRADPRYPRPRDLIAPGHLFQSAYKPNTSSSSDARPLLRCDIEPARAPNYVLAIDTTQRAQ